MSTALSERLAALKKLAGSGNTAADIGCDHGYLSMALVESGAYCRVIACDLREGPLSAAREHIAAAGLNGQIECRQADGLNALAPGEADTIILAGMGGALMIRILRAGEKAARRADRLVLQPQSEVGEFRRWLRENGYGILEEEMIAEDGKYYPMMAVRPGAETDTEEAKIPEELADAYGAKLLNGKHPVLKRFLEEAGIMNLQILQHLKAQQADTPAKETRQKARIVELEKEKQRITEALGLYEITGTDA